MREMSPIKFNSCLKHIHDSKRAFDVLYEYYFPRIVIYVNQKFRCKLGEDIAQEFFLKIMNIPDEEKKKVEYPTTWVMRICERQTIDCIRHEKLQIAYQESDTYSLDITDIKLESQNLFSSLDSSEQKLIYLRYFVGYTLKEISIALNENYNTVKQRFHRMIKKLKSKYL